MGVSTLGPSQADGDQGLGTKIIIIITNIQTTQAILRVTDLPTRDFTDPRSVRGTL